VLVWAGARWVGKNAKKKKVAGIKKQQINPRGNQGAVGAGAEAHEAQGLDVANAPRREEKQKKSSRSGGEGEAGGAERKGFVSLLFLRFSPFPVRFFLQFLFLFSFLGLGRSELLITVERADSS
jgi:hypothetical protein